MRVGWLTDIHLNFLRPAEVGRFMEELAAHRADAWLVGGDIAEAHTVAEYLRTLGSSVGVPVYFVLGNHDYYGGSFESVGAEIEELTAKVPNLIWLSRTGAVSLAGETGLVGHDTWGDARLGNARYSPVELSDFYQIADLADLGVEDRMGVLNRLGDAAARFLERNLDNALMRFAKVICLVHVSPFRGSAWYDGRPSGDDWLPFFSCKAVGDVLLELASRFHDRQILVLCGHTHGWGTYRPLPNLTVLTGGAEYGRPEIQSVMRCS